MLVLTAVHGGNNIMLAIGRSYNIIINFFFFLTFIRIYTICNSSFNKHMSGKCTSWLRNGGEGSSYPAVTLDVI